MPDFVAPARAIFNARDVQKFAASPVRREREEVE
jgi:hypothetical protein